MWRGGAGWAVAHGGRAGALVARRPCPRWGSSTPPPSTTPLPYQPTTRPFPPQAEAERLISADAVARDAVAAVESDGIVFIDEVDKIVVSHELRYGADASSEGVQRDLLPIIEGSAVSTKARDERGWLLGG